MASTQSTRARWRFLNGASPTRRNPRRGRRARQRTQFSLLITVVVLSAILPTAIAQRFFSPDRETELAADRGATAEPSVPIPAEEYV